MNNEKLNSTPKLSIAKREIFRICKDPVYFFCMLVAPTICVVFFLLVLTHSSFLTCLPNIT